MKNDSLASGVSPSALILGVGSFAHSTGQILKDSGVQIGTYLTRNQANFSPSLAGPTYKSDQYPSPVPLLKSQGTQLVIPMSIDWALAPWKQELLSAGVPIFCPTGDAMKIERERDFARELCQRFGIPFPESFVAGNRLAAEKILQDHPKAFVIKNPLCSPTSPIHTIVCETLADTRSWLRHIDYAEGVFLQEYLGPCEAGHIALVSAGEIHSMVTNQEYKRAFAGNMGVVAGAPLGGLVEQDTSDKYGLASELLKPLLPWFREVNYHGPIQVTAVQTKGRWHVIEYNIRIGVTSGAMMLRMLENPFEIMLQTARDAAISPRFLPARGFGCSVTLAAFGYPYVQVRGPQLPIELLEPFDCDVWWNEINRDAQAKFISTGHRIADVVAIGKTLNEAIEKSYANVRKIRNLASYYRPDIGRSLWPPGTC